MTASTAGASFDIGRVIERTFKTIGANFVTFLILSLVLQAIPALIVNILQVSASGGFPGVTTTTPTYDPSTALLSLVGLVVTVLASMLVQAALIRGTFAELSGRRAKLGELLSTGVQFILPLFGLGIVMAIALFFAAILLLFPALILMTMWLVAGPAVVVERKGVFEALGRSAQLTKGSRWPIFGLIVIFAVCIWVVEAVFSFSLLGALVGGGNMTMVAIYFVAMAALSALVSMFSSVGVASTYYELRNMKDGVGAEALASVFD